MGFGFLLLGYLCTFILYLTANRLGVGAFVLLLGYALMFLGVMKLEKYEKRFGFAKLLLIPLFLGGVYQAVGEVLALFRMSLPLFASELAAAIYSWALFLLLMLLQAVLLLSVAAIAKGVGLLHLASKAFRNLIFLGLYGLFYLLYNLPLAWADGAKPYLALPMILCQVILVALNVLLFLSCDKNIAPAGEEDIEPKRYRWEFLNKIGDAFERNRKEAAESGRAYAEEKLRQKKEAREKKRIQHNKKK